MSIQKSGIPTAVSIADNDLETLCSYRMRGGKIELYGKP
jgi:hypothetical protein